MRGAEVRMTSAEGSTNARLTKRRPTRAGRHSGFATPSSLSIRDAELQSNVLASDAQLSPLLKKIRASDRVAIDIEADSLHSYREKLCLLQISVSDAVMQSEVEGSRGAAAKVSRDSSDSHGVTGAGRHDSIVDPLAAVDLEKLRCALEAKEIVLHGADYDLRMLRRGLNLKADRIFDTLIAARLLGVREFSLAALLQRYFGLQLAKGSQKANWAKRPLPARMIEYAINDVRYLLPLAEKLEAELERCGRRDWLRQSCERAIEQAAVTRERKQDQFWRIAGAGALHGQAAAVLRALWQWRESEAEMADRPPFHILRNDNLLEAAVSFASGSVPDYKHFSSRRRQAFREAARSALALPESEWPVLRRRFGIRPTAESVRQMEQLRRRRDKSAEELGLEPSFVAPRNTLEAIATDHSRGASLLVDWQRQLLGIAD